MTRQCFAESRLFLVPAVQNVVAVVPARGDTQPVGSFKLTRRRFSSGLPPIAESFTPDIRLQRKTVSRHSLRRDTIAQLSLDAQYSVGQRWQLLLRLGEAAALSACARGQGRSDEVVIR